MKNEKINIHNLLASRWSRLWASMIDGLLIGLVTVPIVYFTGGFEITESKLIEQSLLYNTLITLLGLIAFILINYKLLINNGQTVGKKVLKIKIVNLDNNLPSKSILLNRYLIYDIPGYIPFVGGWLSMINILFIFGKEKRCIHDYIAKTRVIITTEIKQEESHHSIIEENETTFKLSFPIDKNEIWNNLKIELKEFYLRLGFNNLVLDKDTSWMLKNDNDNTKYISLSLKDNIITLEIYNTEKPNSKIINEIINQINNKD